nr:hypothetical protein [Micromonospora sp. DSM 115978]
MTAFDLSPAQIRNRRILLARRTLRRHWQRTSTCPICGSRPIPLGQALRYLRHHDPTGEPVHGPAPEETPADPDGGRRAVPRPERQTNPRHEHPEDLHAREIMAAARESWPTPDDDDQDEL